MFIITIYNDADCEINKENANTREELAKILVDFSKNAMNGDKIIIKEND